MSKKKLEDYSNREILDMYESNVKSNHYSPMGDSERPLFNSSTLYQEVLRRMDKGETY